MTAISDTIEESRGLHESGGGLPLREELPLEDRAFVSRKDIHKTIGGRITDFLIYGVLGFGGNSGGSLGLTYLVNPKPWAKNIREGATEGLNKLVKGLVSSRDVNRVVEIMFMMISGTALTAVMAPLVSRRARIAHSINKFLGKDTDVLPDYLVPETEPKSVEDRIEQELRKRVNYRQASGDLWKARWTSIWVPLIGDGLLSKWNTAREKAGKWSLDSLGWRTGQHLYDEALPKNWVHGLSRFFSKHGASIQAMKTNNPENFELLSAIENKYPGTSSHHDENDRMMIADQARLFGKEVGWTLILAGFVERLTRWFHDRRVNREEQKAIADMTREGIVPEGYRVVLGEGVRLERLPEPKQGPTWTEKTGKTGPSRTRLEKSESYLSAIDKSRSGLSEQLTH